ncbi:MAG: hypothetical protein Q8N99_01815 [Nanoarchaeota archaeon]|nr:hypothetical protein [Nanoarchaeota archaeon]
MKKLLFITTIVLIMGLIGNVIAQNNGYTGCFGPGMMYGNYPGFAILGWITYILFIGLIIAGIYWLIKSANKKR